MRSMLATVPLLLIVGGCGSYPVATVEQGPSSSGIYFRAPADAEAWVDGQRVGSAAIYDGKRKLLTVSSGTHRVVLQSSARIILDQEVYVGPAARVEVRAQ